jgi:molybdate transport system ATP-binding protein
MAATVECRFVAIRVRRYKPVSDRSQNLSEGQGLAARVQRQFNSGTGQFQLSVDFAAPPGINILFGPSGAGKTTLLECLAGLAQPDAGSIAVGERVLFDSARDINIPVAQRSIAYVFQSLALFPHLTVEKNVHYGLAHLPAAEKQSRTRAVLQSFRVEQLLDRKPDEISGGERQRVALARSLVTDPCLLLLDEPLAALDPATKSMIIADLREWNAAHNIPILYVTHSREEVFALGERVIVLDRGRILARGTPQEVLTAPRHEMLAQAAGFENLFDGIITALHEAHGTMTCRIADGVELEVPLARVAGGSPVRLAIRAGDILVATEPPRGLSARNVIRGKLLSLDQQGVRVIATVDCGARFEVHLTPSAVHTLNLSAGRELWLVIKTYSCHLVWS